MDFAEARATFLRPRAGAATPETGTPARRLRHVLEPLAMINVWSAPAHEHLAKAGLDFLTGYVGGRACVLGDPSPGVVAATFAVFEPGLAGELDELLVTLGRWADHVVAAGWFPPDPYKRAAG